MNPVNPVSIFRLPQFLLGGIFLYAGMVKLRDPLAFADSIASFKILPPFLINPLALGLSPFEIFTGLMLVGSIARSSTLNGRWMRCVGALSAILLCGIFCLALASALLRGIPVDCGCFGKSPSSPLKTGLALGRDLVFLGLALWLYRRELARVSAPDALAPRQASVSFSTQVARDENVCRL